MIRLLALLAAFLTIAAPTLAGDPEKIDPLPWHLAALWSKMTNDIEFERLSLDIEFGGVENKPDVHFFLVPLMLTINDVDCYAGFVTSPSNTIREGRNENHDCDSVRFTRFSKLSDSIVKAEGGFWFESGHEGDHACAWKEYAFKQGKYRLELVTKTLKNNRVLVKCFVRVQGEKLPMFVGGLEFAGRKAVLNRRAGIFYEICGRKSDGSQRPEGDLSKLVMPVSKVAFSRLCIDDVDIDFVEVVAQHREGMPQKALIAMPGKKGEEYITIETGETEYPRQGFVAVPVPRREDELNVPGIKPTSKLYRKTLMADPAEKK